MNHQPLPSIIFVLDATQGNWQILAQLIGAVEYTDCISAEG